MLLNVCQTVRYVFMQESWFRITKIYAMSLNYGQVAKVQAKVKCGQTVNNSDLHVGPMKYQIVRLQLCPMPKRYAFTKFGHPVLK